MTSYKYLIQEVEAFILAHPTAPKFFAEFKEQMPNLATIDEKYPLVFMIPESSVSGQMVINYNVEIYCLDLINDDRSNINDILSEMSMLMNDIYQHFSEYHDNVFINVPPVTTPLNNFDLDYVAGWVGSFGFEVPQICDNLLN